MNRELAELALDIGREAAALLLAGSADVAPVATKTSPHDLVTQRDRESEDLIRRRIEEARPGDQVLGEEQGTVGARSDVKWIVDPLDGTVNYFYGQPAWAVSIGVERAGQPCAGVVVAPALGEEYVAVAGEGSWTIVAGDWRRLAVSGQEQLADSVVGTGFGYVAERRADQGRIVAALLPHLRDIRRVGAAALDLCWVGAGRLDAHYERGLQPWDRAAGSLVAAEAGAIVAGLPGQPAGTELAIAASPAVYPELARRLADLGVLAGP